MAVVLTIKQTQALELLEDDIHTSILVGGGAGSSKSFIGVYWLLKSALKYNGSRWILGRARLTTLKTSTLLTLFEVAKMQGVLPDVHYTYNQQQNVINFFNGSIIFLKDLQHYPSDPEYDSLAGLEITGAFLDEVQQMTQKAVDMVSSRVRYGLNEFGLIPKVLMSCNPSTGFLYKEFYIPHKEGKLKPYQAFIPSTVLDNPYISKHYIDNLKKLPKKMQDRLLRGLWEVSDDASLINYQAITDVFSNDFVVGNSKYYITADIARMGKDKAVIMLWDGLVVKEIYTFDISKLTDLVNQIKILRAKYNIPASRIICDNDGLSIVDFLPSGVIGFHNNGKALNDENYYNIKTQLYYKLAEYINNNKIYIEAEIDTDIREYIIEELEQVKCELNDNDSKLKIKSKGDVKSAIGRSPDYSDSIMMRMYFEIEKKNNGSYNFSFS